jgi:hypothetical protein
MRCVEMPDGRSRAVGRLYLDTGDAYGDWQSWELRIFVVDFHEGELTGAIPLDELGYWSETRDITLLPDGSIAAVGWIRPSLQQAGSPTVRPLVLGLDPDGGLEWRETFDFGGKAGTVSAYPGGGLLVGGETEDRGFLIRTDEVGEL